MVVPAQVGTPRTGNRETRLAPGPKAFLRILDDAITQKGGFLPPTHDYPSETLGIDYDYFRQIYVATLGQGKTAEAIRKDISFNGSKLLAEGLIGRFDPHVWITRRGTQYVS